jgi:hypothetical protein
MTFKKKSADEEPRMRIIELAAKHGNCEQTNDAVHANHAGGVEQVLDY